MNAPVNSYVKLSTVLLFSRCYWNWLIMACVALLHSFPRLFKFFQSFLWGTSEGGYIGELFKMSKPISIIISKKLYRETVELIFCAHLSPPLQNLGIAEPDSLLPFHYAFEWRVLTLKENTKSDDCLSDCL